ncbi:MAG: hypothetical protein ACFBSD_04920 [Paracoccaceae bacterium]
MPCRHPQPSRGFRPAEGDADECPRREPAAENRNARPAVRRHLEGRIVWVERVPLARSARLRALFERIDWR